MAKTPRDWLQPSACCNPARRVKCLFPGDRIGARCSTIRRLIPRHAGRLLARSGCVGRPISASRLCSEANSPKLARPGCHVGRIDISDNDASDDAGREDWRPKAKRASYAVLGRTGQRGVCRVSSQPPTSSSRNERLAGPPRFGRASSRGSGSAGFHATKPR